MLKSRNRVKRFAFFTSLFHLNSGEIKHDISDFNHPGIQLEQKEAMELLFRSIYSLPNQQKTVLILTKIEDLSIKETAEIMNKTPKSIASLLQRAKQNLKKKITEAKDSNKIIV